MIVAEHSHNCQIKADITPRACHQHKTAVQAYGVLEKEYEALRQVSPKVHQNGGNCMSVIEYVHDIMD